MNKLSGAKEYRYWIQRLKNALDQARPEHGRKLIAYLDTLTENMVNQQSELSQETDHISWIKELIVEKEDDEKKGRTPEATLDSFNRDLWAVLVAKCENEAIHKVNSAEQGEGLWAYIRVHQWFNKTTELGKMSRVIDSMRPEACKHEHEIAAAIEKWERNYRRIIEEDKADPLPERCRMTAIKCLLVGEIKRHVTLREDELDTYQQLSDVVMKYAVNRRIEKERGNIAMEVDAAMDNDDADQIGIRDQSTQ